ncbi:MAG: transaldolase [Clostridiales Family XIII bacterium]|jgi:transaldolase|nr:transaldolase [Clostridiales Family XIII bacterium]
MNKHTKRISDVGVSIWLDDLSRSKLQSGLLERLIDERNVVGVTTNPSIFNKAILSETLYDAQIAELAQTGASGEEVLFELTCADVLAAADIFLPVYQRTNSTDGRVSIEVDPRFARDAVATIRQAKELWAKIDRPNIMIKIPAVPESLPAITEALANGLSVNATLIFSKERYLQVIDAFITGLEKAHTAGHDLSKIDSVASFFVSRVDTAIDKQLEETGTEDALSLRGKTALANAIIAYAAYENAFSNDARWSALEKAHAKKQRPLWASTGVKNPAYPPTLYVTELAGMNVVNTMPEPTLDALSTYAGEITDKLRGGLAEAQEIFTKIERILGEGTISAVLEKLEQDGVRQFEDAWNDLLADIGRKIQTAK